MRYSLQDQALVFYGTLAECGIADCLPLLSEQDRARAERYTQAGDKRRYIIARARLKQLLSDLLQADAGALEFNCNENGKPFLCSHPRLQFNLAHADDALVIACTHGSEIGVDVESLNRPVNIAGLQNFLFSPAELERFRNMPAHGQQPAFIDCWTRKEAFLKAGGQGLSQGMNKLEAPVIANVFFPSPDPDWFLESRTLMQHYRVALAVKGRVKAVQYLPLPHPKMLLTKAS